MVRTRRSDLSLATRVIGRGRHDKHHADDVHRRRPTASARRQRVHVARAEDVPQVTEDIPHVTEHVPHVDEDILTADVDVADVAADGAEGSPAQHGEGFPGGPHDTSLLTSFADHVEQPELKLVSHGRKVDKFGSPAPKIEGLVVGTGLSPLIDCSVVTGNPRLISAFVERWHRETNTFHLPMGELMITLDDVVCLLHLPITEALHRFEPLGVDEAVLLLMELLEVSGEEARVETILITYLLHLVGCTLFANKSATHVHVVHLEGFRDLGQSRGYAWGVVVLVHMYDQLNEASQTPTRQMGGYLTLLQCWIYEYFPSVHQCVTDDGYAEKTPRASRWLTMKAHMKGIKGAPYRGQLRWGHVVVYVRPERVVQQFGYMHTIPPLPVTSLLSYEDISDRWMHFGDHLAPAGEICVVPSQVSADYMEWFFQISHPFVMSTQEGDEPRHPPAPDVDAYVEPHIPEVPVPANLPRPSVVAYEGCEAIAKRLERVLNLRMVTARTELHEIMEDCLRIARGDTSDGSLRARRRQRID
ncbi:serine/threonine-protein phosphatase 7 long form homolog [Glycine max]|uniref:serine/threonine-protein phosphatase 7 long form homolog n=1 Tax=Glycine max TaxID=3847 RepID=UPI0003DEB69D|nr:serine/threonine-protein phosphatase 7 long form homolog [Glycine max]|eukprot:XP_006593214.1 serine/threonine-protein phosphatase 7 long form homolog [Glycine max]